MSTTEDMINRIERECSGCSHNEVTELNLDNCQSSGEVEGLTEKFTSLRKLSLINCGITSLKNFPSLPKLRKLEVSDNRITGSLQPLGQLTSLVHLNLSGNKIEDIEALSPLSNLNHLKLLDLFNCGVTKLPQYRENVYDLIPSLEILDGFDKSNVEVVDSEDEEGKEEAVEKNGNAEDVNDEENADESPTNSRSVEDEESDDDDDASYDGSEEGEEYGLDYLARDEIEDEDDDEDYEEEAEQEDEEITEEDEEGGGGDEPRGMKRKLEAEEDEQAPV